MKGVGVKIDNKNLNKLMAKFNEFEGMEKEIDQEMRKAVIHAENGAAKRFTQNFSQLSGSGRSSITSGKTKGGYYVAAIAKYMPFLEWGTRNRFHKGNFRDMLKLGIPESYAQQFKAVPLKKATNIEGKPYFFPAVKDAFAQMMQNLRNRVKRMAA